MIELILKSPIDNSVLFSDNLTVSYEVRDTDAVFSRVEFVVYDKNSTAFQSFLSPESSKVGLLSAQNLMATNSVVFKQETTVRQDLFNITNLKEGEYYMVAVVYNKYGKEIPSTKKTINFSTKPITVEIQNKLSSVVSSSIPNFLERDYEIFTDFIKQYYVWLESSKNITFIPHNIEQFLDIDTTPPELLNKFYETYLPLFPQKYAKDRESGIELDIRKVIKNIRDFYSKKGTEDSFRFLFRVMFDTEITISYPKEKMLFCSNSKWIKPIIIRISDLNETSSAELIGKKIYTLDEENNVTFSADVEDTTFTTIENIDTCTVQLSNIFGTLTTNYVYVDLLVSGVEERIKLNLIRMVVKVEPKTTCTEETAGYGFKVGELLRIRQEKGYFHICMGCVPQQLGLSGAVKEPGYSFLAVIEKVKQDGQMEKIRIIDPGVGFDGALNTMYPILVGNRVVSCKVILYGDYIFYSEGYYLSKNSLLSEINNLQDNFYYQLNSYEIGSNITSYRYADTLKQNVHPAGYQPFYRYDILDLLVQGREIITVPNFGTYELGAIDENGDNIPVLVDVLPAEAELVSPNQDVGISQISFFRVSSYQTRAADSTDIISTDEQDYSSTDYISSIGQIEPLDFNPVTRNPRRIV